MATIISTDTDDAIEIVNNAYLDDTTWKYKANGFASRIRILSSATVFYHVASGLADDPITWVVDVLIETPGKVYIGEATGLTNNGRLGVQPNSAVDIAYPGGVLFSTYTHTGNITTGDDTLATFTIAAGTMAPKQCIRFEAWGVTANNANVKTLRFKLGATTFASRIMTPSVASNWLVHGTIKNVSTSNEECVTHFQDGAIAEVDLIAITENANTDLAFVVTGEGTASSDIVLWGLTIWWDEDGV